jgi:predicted nucleic acid-binding protein
MAAEPGLGEGKAWVVDASVAFGWFAAIPGAEQAALLLDPPWNQGLLAPDLILVELLNAGWKSLRVGAITDEQFDWLAHRASEPFTQLFASGPLMQRAGHWCRELNHPAYDCLYIALAEQQHATLITADQRLLRKLQEARPGLPASMHLGELKIQL